MKISHCISKNKNGFSKGNTKGFTLVELLVVLVIIAILMAAIIPSMLGFIDKAKHETIMTECRNAYTATMVVFNENYAKDKYEWMKKAPITGTTENFTSKDRAAADLIADHSAIGGEIETVEIRVDSSKRPYVFWITYKASNGVPYGYKFDTDTRQGEWTVF